MSFIRPMASATISVALLLSACGDDGSDAESTDGDELEAYCAIAAELAASGESAPTEEQLDRIRETAPDEIKDAVDAATGIIEEHLAAGENPFDDPDLEAPITEIQAFDAEHCG